MASDYYYVHQTLIVDDEVSIRIWLNTWNEPEVAYFYDLQDAPKPFGQIRMFAKSAIGEKKLKFRIVRNPTYSMVGVVADTEKEKLLILCDFSEGKCWPGNINESYASRRKEKQLLFDKFMDGLPGEASYFVDDLFN